MQIFNPSTGQLQTVDFDMIAESQTWSTDLKTATQSFVWSDGHTYKNTQTWTGATPNVFVSQTGYIKQ